MRQKKSLFIKALLSVCFIAIFASCAKDEECPIIPETSEVKVVLNKPVDIANATYSDIQAVFTNATSAEKVYANGYNVFNDTIKVFLQEGDNKMELQARIHFTDQNGVVSEGSISLSDNIPVNTENKEIVKVVTPEYKKPTSGFVIEEIFFTSTLTPEGKPYFASGDQYLKITNNSDETLYADGLAMLESKFLTVTKWDYTPNIMDKAMAVQAVYVIPGNGSEHPVKPGESLIIANNAIDHTKENANSIDLSKADFEWYDESSNPRIQDIDNPDVPNLEKYYASTATIHGFHNRGFTAIAIAKVPITKYEFLETHKYDYTYIFSYGSFVKEMSGSAYQVPNKWIVDAVNLSATGEFAWIVTDPSLDSGWTYCSEGDHDKTRHGLAVRRKVDREANGRKYFKDTNNSTEDFEPRVKPSLMK